MASIKRHANALANRRDAAALKPLFDATRTEAGATVTLANELHDDHATFKTAVDETKTLADELHDDHATFKTAVDETKTFVDELHDDHATVKTYLDNIKSLINELRTAYLTRLFSGYPGFAIKSDFDVGNANAFQVAKDGIVYNIAGSQVWDTGTAATCATEKWLVLLLSVDNDATTHVDYADNSDAGYDSEAEAIAAIDGISASGEVVVGYVTVQAGGDTWLAGTDALAGGTGGTVANATNYYNAINPDATLIGAAISDTLATLTAPKPTAGPATLTASKPTAGPATLTASKATAGPATLTASKPTAGPATLTASKATATLEE
jgi:hypothetical protein